jgi:WD40 repeat protein
VKLEESALELKVLSRLQSAIHSLAFDSQTLLIGTSQGVQREDWIGLEAATPAKTSPCKLGRSSIRRSLGLLHETEKSLTAIGTLKDHIITLDNDGCLRVESKGDASMPTVSAAHRSVIQGVHALPTSAEKGAFFTYSKDGDVKFWNSDGALLKHEMLDLDSTGDEQNELTLMRYSNQHDAFAVGDRFGVLRLVSREWEVMSTVRAHSAEISSIDLQESLMVTCSRDRTVQLLRLGESGLELVQTMDDHAGAVTQVLFAGDKLLSCSTDRSLIIRERTQHGEGVVYLTTKVLSLKGSPQAFAMLDATVLAVSTMDRKITKVDVAAGTLLDSYKAGDLDSDDTVFLNSMIVTNNMLVGYSSLDKSIRAYDDKISLMAKESGHTEGVSDIALLEQGQIVTTGMDGTIMTWRITKNTNLNLSPTRASESDAKRSPASLPPVRKVLTKIEITELTGSPLSPRSLSPMRLKRRTSRLALSTTMDDVAEESKKSPRRSPSPPLQLRTRRSQRNIRTDPDDAPITPKAKLLANNGRLRRPPSMPDNLRAHAAAQGQRQSMSQDFGSMAMATDQATRMLRTYKKKLVSNREAVDLDDLQVELEGLLKVIRTREDRVGRCDASIDELAMLLKGISMSEISMIKTDIAAPSLNRVPALEALD